MTERELLHHEIDALNQDELAEVYTVIQELRHKKLLSRLTSFNRFPEHLLDPLLKAAGKIFLSFFTWMKM